MARKKRWEYARISDFVTAFGKLDLNTLTYEQYFGLSLNVDRAYGRQAFSVFLGVAAASPNAKVSAGFFEPVTYSREEAEDAAYEVNAQRTLARAMAEMSHGK
jgi:hypothetical protein